MQTGEAWASLQLPAHKSIFVFDPPFVLSGPISPSLFSLYRLLLFVFSVFVLFGLPPFPVGVSVWITSHQSETGVTVLLTDHATRPLNERPTRKENGGNTQTYTRRKCKQDGAQIHGGEESRGESSRVDSIRFDSIWLDSILRLSNPVGLLVEWSHTRTCRCM